MNLSAAASEFRYVGSELALFEKARNWKAYWRDRIVSYVHGDVLEVGAGIGANTRLLAGLAFSSWTCLEPDAALAQVIKLPSEDRYRTAVGTLQDLPAGEHFDSILYIDVLEHIEDDRAELARARDRLRPGGTLIVLSPAHPFLYTEFDRAIGHYRRYTRSSLRALKPAGLCERKLIYLDSAGMLASAGNRLLLKSAMPTEQQILAWDRLLVPVSRGIDGIFAGCVGKTVLGIWRRSYSFA
jgi:SAM-dependent methyltransferase